MIHMGRLKDKATISVQIIEDPDGNTVAVFAEYKGIEGADYLGDVDYDSELDFIDHSPYYEDMVQDALFDLAARLEQIYRAIDEVRDHVVWMRWQGNVNNQT